MRHRDLATKKEAALREATPKKTYDASKMAYMQLDCKNNFARLDSSWLAPVEDADLVVAKISSAQHLLVEATTICSVKQILDMAEALRIYFSRVSASQEIQNVAARMMLDAERKLGELFAAMPDSTPGPKNNSITGSNLILSLEDLKISKRVSARAQKLAVIPTGKIMTFVNEFEREGSLTANQIHTDSMRHGNRAAPH